jgi:hypothetical protein
VEKPFLSLVLYRLSYLPVWNREGRIRTGDIEMNGLVGPLRPDANAVREGLKRPSGEAVEMPDYKSGA